MTGPAADVLALFDWNGTIMLDRDRARDALNLVLQTRSLTEVTSYDFGSTFQLPMSIMFTGLGVAQRELEQAEQEWNDAISDVAATTRDGTTEALDELVSAGVTLGIVSAAAEHSIRADLARSGIGEPFTTIDTAVTDKVALLRRRRGLFQHAYYVGDTAYDMRSALAADYVPIGVSGGYASPGSLIDAGATAIIDDVRELPDLIRRGMANG